MIHGECKILNMRQQRRPGGSGGGYSGRSEGAGAEKRSEYLISTRV
jgi:hypothetical protein